MWLKIYCIQFVVIWLMLPKAWAQKNVFPIVADANNVSIIYDGHGTKLDSICANLLSEDIERVTSFKPNDDKLNTVNFQPHISSVFLVTFQHNDSVYRKSLCCSHLPELFMQPQVPQPLCFPIPLRKGIGHLWKQDRVGRFILFYCRLLSCQFLFCRLQPSHECFNFHLPCFLIRTKYCHSKSFVELSLIA